MTEKSPGAVTYKCGCVNDRDNPSGILHSVWKCAAHRREYRDQATLGRDYYAEFGLLTEDDQLAETQHVAELVDALGPLPASTLEQHDMIEVGCGVSPYVGAFIDKGWRYTGIDPSPFAVRCMERLCFPYLYWQFAQVHFEDVPLSRLGLNDLILCAHALEHMQDAPAALRKMADALAPGGQLWLIVPDDEDPVNPDHLWFFTETTLRVAVEAAGLKVDRLASRRHVKHESFLYCRASKPV